MDENYLAWVAGFTDGEGSICVGIQVKPDNERGRSCFLFNPMVTVTQHVKNRHVLDELVTNFGYGTVYLRCGGTVTHYQTGRRASTKDFLLKLQPYLRVKRRQADSLLEVIDILDANSRRKGISFAAGERALTLPVVNKLIDLAVGMNPRLDGTSNRYSGNSRESLYVKAQEIYG